MVKSYKISNFVVDRNSIDLYYEIGGFVVGRKRIDLVTKQNTKGFRNAIGIRARVFRCGYERGVILLGRGVRGGDPTDDYPPHKKPPRPKSNSKGGGAGGVLIGGGGLC